MITVQDLTADLKDAMRAGESVKRDTIRAIITALKNEAIAQKVDANDLSEGAVLAVLKRAKKQRDEAATQYTDGGRAELAEQERAEAEIIAAYLPEQMDEAQIAAVVDEVVAAVGAENFGAVMGQVMGRVKGKADGALVKKVVDEKLKG